MVEKKVTRVKGLTSGTYVESIASKAFGNGRGTALHFLHVIEINDMYVAKNEHNVLNVSSWLHSDEIRYVGFSRTGP